jgi:hypothetical protein
MDMMEMAGTKIWTKETGENSAKEDESLTGEHS